MSTVRVLFVAKAPFFSGAERALLLTVSSLDPARYQPVVAVGSDGELLRHLRDRNIESVRTRVDLSDLRTAPRWAASVAHLTWLGRRYGVSLMHANEATSFQPVGYAARWLGIPALTHVRFPDGSGAMRWYLKPGCAHTFFVSKYMRDDTVVPNPRLFGTRVSVLYDGVQSSESGGSVCALSTRKRFNIPEDSPAVVLAGQVIEIKGIWDYIEAARILLNRGIRASFVVLGDDLKGNGETRARAEERVRDLGLAGAFHFLGFQPNAPELLRAFDISVVPSHVEPLGNATLEAMAAGLPVVGSAVGGIPEMVDDGSTGLLVPAKSPKPLADALQRLITDNQLRLRMGIAGRERVQNVFSLPRHAEQLQATYDAILSGVSAGEPAMSAS